MAYKPLKIGGYCGKGLHLLTLAKDIYIGKSGKKQCRRCKEICTKRYSNNNRERLIANSRKWHLANKERALQKSREWKNRNQERSYLSNRKSHLKRTFGISLAYQQDLASIQHGLCGICNKELGSRPLVDHNHKTKRVRGLLCRKCNTGLGQFDDSINVLRRAIQYLERSESLQG